MTITTFRQGAPVLLGDRMVARLAMSTASATGALVWTWHSDAFEPPRMERGPRGHPIPVNRGELRVAFERGPVQILEAILQGDDRQRAFQSVIFTRPDARLAGPPTSLAAAYELVLHDEWHDGDPMLDRLRSRRAYWRRRAKRELEGA